MVSLEWTYIVPFYIITFIVFPFMISGMCSLLGKLLHPKIIKIYIFPQIFAGLVFRLDFNLPRIYFLCVYNVKWRYVFIFLKKYEYPFVNLLTSQYFPHGFVIPMLKHTQISHTWACFWILCSVPLPWVILCNAPWFIVDVLIFTGQTSLPFHSSSSKNIFNHS